MVERIRKSDQTKTCPFPTQNLANRSDQYIRRAYFHKFRACDTILSTFFVHVTLFYYGAWNICGTEKSSLDYFAHSFLLSFGSQSFNCNVESRSTCWGQGCMVCLESQCWVLWLLILLVLCQGWFVVVAWGWREWSLPDPPLTSSRRLSESGWLLILWVTLRFLSVFGCWFCWWLQCQGWFVVVAQGR